jgi:glycosyltransferase involved in cell wall biosynthesis
MGMAVSTTFGGASGGADMARATTVRRIVVLGSYAPALINFRGPLLQAMRANGHSVLALAPERDEIVAKSLKDMGVEFGTVPMARATIAPLTDLRTILALYRVLRAEKPDIFLAYNVKPVIYGGLAARLAGVPHRFAMIEGLGFVFTDDGTVSRTREIMRTLCSALYRMAVGGADAVIVLNPDDGKELKTRCIVRPGQPLIEVGGTGIDLAYYAEAPLPSGPPVFLLIARLLRHKGLVEYVEAARRLRAKHPGVRVQLLGPLDSNPSGISRGELDAWVGESTIEYLGETDDVRRYLAASTAYVLPSYREGIPRTVLEAMATGRAIITTDSPGCRETVIPGENGFLVPVRDPTALASAMERFVLDPSLASRMGRRSREMAEARFDVHRVNDALLTTMRLA